MNKLILILLLIASFTATGQTTTIGGKKTTVENLGGFKSDSTLGLPKRYATTNYANSDSTARIWFDIPTLSPWFHNGTARKRIASTTFVDSSITVATANLVHIYLYKATGVDAATVGNYAIGTTEASRGNFIITNVNYVFRLFTGTIVVSPVLSVGFTPTAYTDDFGPVTLSATPTVNTVSLNTGSNKFVVPAATPIIARISTAATFTTTGTYIIDVYVQGYYETL